MDCTGKFVQAGKVRSTVGSVELANGGEVSTANVNLGLLRA